MSYIAKLTYTESLIRQATFAYWRRSIGIATPLLLILLIIYAVYLGISGNRAWQFGAISVVCIFGILILPLVYSIHYKNGIKKLRDMGEPIGEFRTEDKGFTLTSGIGSSFLKWISVQEVWCFHDFWLLLFSKSQFATIPLANVTPEMQGYIIQHVKDAGGKIVA